MKLRYLVSSEEELKELQGAMAEFSKYYGLMPHESFCNVTKTTLINTLDITPSSDCNLERLFFVDPAMQSSAANPPLTRVEAEPFSERPHLGIILGKWKYNIYFKKEEDDDDRTQ